MSHSPSEGWADVGAAITEGFTSAYAMTPEERTAAYREAIAHATTPKPLPSPDTRDGLLARLNARHHSTRTPA